MGVEKGCDHGMDIRWALQGMNETSWFAETWIVLGRIELLDKQPAAAERSLRRHLDIEPESTQGLFQLGLALLSQDRFEEAAASFHRATRLKPDFGAAHFNHGFALMRLGHLREALPSFREAIRQNPEHFETYLLLVDLHLRLGEKEPARQCLRADQHRA